MAFISQTSVPSTDFLLNIDCDSSVQKTDWVRLNSEGVAIKASATSLADSDVLGIVEDVSQSGTTCRVRVGGVSKLNFNNTLSPGTYFLSISSGQMSQIVPSGNGNVVYPIAYAVDSSTIIVELKMRMQRAL